MTDQLPTTPDEPERQDLPQITRFPRPEDQQLVDAILRDPLTPAAAHMQALKARRDGQGYASMNTAAGQASKRLKRPEVQAYLRIQQERIRIAADLEKDDLLQHLASIIHTDISQIARWDDEGRVIVQASEDLPTHARRSIKKLKTRTTRRYFKEGDMEETINTELELYSRTEAIELFAKVAGVLKEAGSVNVQNGVIIMPPVMSEDEATKGKTIHEG